jgi:hypothetical protein
MLKEKKKESISEKFLRVVSLFQFYTFFDL